MFKRPFISGFLGSGVSNIAHFFTEKGIKFYGSEIKKTELSERFKSLGNEVFYGQSAKNVIDSNPDAFFYSQAIEDGPGSVELLEARKLGIPCFKNAEGYFELFKDKKIIAISGAHGKTTTTALTSLIFEAAGLSPTCIIGAPIKEFANQNFPEGRSFKLGEGDFVVLEACEYRRQFLSLKDIFVLAILNIEHDHPDCYKDLRDVKSAFSELKKNVSSSGFILDLSSGKPPFKILNVERKKGGITEFTVFFDLLDFSWVTRENFGFEILPDLIFSFETPLIGEHNLKNIATAFFVFLAAVFCDAEKRKPLILAFRSEKALKKADFFVRIKEKIKNFSGTERRQEFVCFFGSRKGVKKIPFYDDYAHHPTQIKVTIEAFLERFQKVAVAFESHQYKRTKDLYDEFVRSFGVLKGKGALFLFPVYKVPGRDKDEDYVDHRLFASDIKRMHGLDVETFDSYEEIPSFFEKVSRLNFDCVLNLGAGPLSSKLREFLRSKMV